MHGDGECARARFSLFPAQAYLVLSREFIIAAVVLLLILLLLPLLIVLFLIAVLPIYINIYIFSPSPFIPPCFLSVCIPWYSPIHTIFFFARDRFLHGWPGFILAAYRVGVSLCGPWASPRHRRAVVSRGHKLWGGGGRRGGGPVVRS